MLEIEHGFGNFPVPLEKGAKHSSQATLTSPRPMRYKTISNSLKRQRKSFHLARYDPEGWERERNASLAESLHEAQERANKAEREVEVRERLLSDCRKEVSLIPIQKSELYIHETRSLISRVKNYPLKEWHARTNNRSARQ